MESAGNAVRSPLNLSWANETGSGVWQCNLEEVLGFVESLSTACIKVRLLIMQSKQVSMVAVDNSDGCEEKWETETEEEMQVSF